jgi:hypothetical protein
LTLYVLRLIKNVPAHIIKKNSRTKKIKNGLYTYYIILHRNGVLPHNIMEDQIIFLIFGKKSMICAEELILREKNFHGKNVIICV